MSSRKQFWQFYASGDNTQRIFRYVVSRHAWTEELAPHLVSLARSSTRAIDSWRGSFSSKPAGLFPSPTPRLTRLDHQAPCASLHPSSWHSPCPAPPVSCRPRSSLPRLDFPRPAPASALPVSSPPSQEECAPFTTGLGRACRGAQWKTAERCEAVGSCMQTPGRDARVEGSFPAMARQICPNPADKLPRPRIHHVHVSPNTKKSLLLHSRKTMRCSKRACPK